MKMKYVLTGLLMALGLAQVEVQAKNYCGDLKNGYGPFDYRNAASLPAELSMVEGHHFTTEVENNVSGQEGAIAGDLDYTLRAWPNHPRALASMSRQSILEKQMKPRGANYPVDCYFLRAFQFAPDDAMPHAVYGNHLQAVGKPDQAMVEFRRAVELDPDNATISYNAGLAYFRAKQYDKALALAKKAYAKNFPLPGLKNKLIAVGRWDDKPLQQAGTDNTNKLEQ
jgi:tetratricopeptide (TPR) repeat protein